MANIPEIAQEVQGRVARKLAGFLGPDRFDDLPKSKTEMRTLNRAGPYEWKFSQDDLIEMSEAVVGEALQAISETVK